MKVGDCSGSKRRLLLFVAGLSAIGGSWTVNSYTYKAFK